MKTLNKYYFIFQELRIFFFIIFFCFIAGYRSHGQLNRYLTNMDSSQNYYSIKNTVIEYLDSLQSTMDSSEFFAGGGEFKEFKKFEKMWESRISSHGNFMKYFDSEYDYFESTTEDYSYIIDLPWQELGPNKIQNTNEKGIGPVEFITFFDNGTSQSTQFMLTGSLLGGLFYSTDFGNTWNKTGTDNWAQSGCSWAVFHPTNHFIWYASSSGNSADGTSSLIGKTGGIFKTLDEGQSFIQIANNNDLEGEYTIIFKLAIDPNNPQILYAVTSKGIFKTSDCESSDPTWIKVLTGLIFDLEMKPSNSSVLYAAARIYNSWKIVISQNYGNSWNEMLLQPAALLSTNLRDQYFTVEVSNQKPENLYCLVRDYPEDKLFYFDFVGSSTWVEIDDQDNNYGYGNGHSFGVDQVTNGEMILVAKETGIGKYFIDIGHVGDYSTVHVDVEDIIYHPYNPSEVWACTHGGVEKSIDGGITWEPKYDGLGVAQVEKFATSFTNPEYILTGLYHDGVQLTDSYYEPDWNPTWKWLSSFNVDGMKPLIDNKNPNNMWGSGQKGKWKYSSNVFQTQTTVSYSGTAYWQTIGVLNKEYPAIFFRNKLYTNTNNKEEVYRSSDHGLISGINEYISSFASLFPVVDLINILGLYTPYNNEDYLVLYLSDLTPPPEDVRTWHVFRTTNANAPVNDIIWEDLIIPRTTNAWLSAIEFDPDNPDIVYLAYSNSSNETYATEMIFKIDYSNALVPVFTDITKNLPLTVARENCIATEKGSNGSVYLATEFGVFYTNNEQMANTGDEWKLVGTKLPHVPINGIEINYVSNNLRVATWGRGVWEIQLPCLYSEQPIVIDCNIIWNSYMRLDRSVVINSGATLTINEESRIAFPDEAKIIIHPGGKLILDGGTLTNGCGDIWQGIEVWGNPNATQIPANQGILQVINGGTIENAEVAVRVGSEDYTGKGGGIVYAAHANFKNNSVGAWFDPYSYTNDNLSYFWYCNFDYDLTITGEPDFTFAKLNDVHKVEFMDCEFTNNTNQDHVGVGIESINSIFSVEGQCIAYSGEDCTEWNYGLFQNLGYAIYATAANATDYADVRHTTFTNNFRGIYLSGMTLPRVTSNWFYLNEMAAEESYGLYLDGSTQYWVEDNNFRKCDECERETGIGIYVNASGAQPNEIYLNAFDGVEYAVITLGVNRTDRTTGEGLVIRCNDYNNTLFDETIIYDGLIDPPPANEGISKYQGSYSLNAEDMAGNLFYYNTTVSGDFDDLNNESNHFYYYYSNNAGANNVEPLDYTAGTVQKVPRPIGGWTYEEGCPSNLTIGGGGGSEESRAAMTEAMSDIANTEAVLAALVDGGDTESLKTEVETSTPPETSDIYTELMAGSPNLSETVVETSIEKEEVLPNAMIRDIMVANPHTSTSLQLLDKLDDRTNPMPAWMKAQILAGRGIQSLKTELEGQLASHEMAKYRAMNRLARHFSQMPENPSIADSLITLYQSDNTVSSRYMQAWLYLYSGQYQQGQNIMTTIPSIFTLTEDELAEYQNMQWLYNMLKGLFESGYGLDSLSGAQIVQLLEIVADETGFASVYARNILLAIDESEYQEPVILPNSMKSAEAEGIYNETLKTKAPSMLEVYPNPSKDFVIIGYQFDTETEGMIEVRDVSGKLIKSIPVKGMQDQLSVTTRTWKAGVYMLSLVVNDKVIETTKFTLVK